MAALCVAVVQLGDSCCLGWCAGHLANIYAKKLAQTDQLVSLRSRSDTDSVLAFRRPAGEHLRQEAGTDGPAISRKAPVLGPEAVALHCGGLWQELCGGDGQVASQPCQPQSCLMPKAPCGLRLGHRVSASCQQPSHPIWGLGRWTPR